MAVKIPKDREDKWVYGAGDIKATGETYVPKNLKAIISAMPKDDEKAFAFLQEKVKSKTITIDEFRWILKITQE